MKIVQINVSGNGSTGRIAENLHNRFIRKGFESYCFFGRNASGEDYVDRVGGFLNTYSHGIIARLGFNGHGSHIATAALCRRLREIQPDIVLLHNIHGYYINIRMLFETLRGLQNTRIIWMLHDAWAFTGGCAYFSAVNCEKWTDDGKKDGHCKNCPICRTNYPISYIDRRSIGYREKYELFTSIPEDRMSFISPSEWLKSEFQKSFLKNYKIKVVKNQADKTVFYRRSEEEIKKCFEKYEVPTRKPIVLGVASVWDSRKQPEFFEKIALKMPDCTVVTVGMTARQSDKYKNIIAIPRTESADELACIYSGASVLLNPSLEDNAPLVPLEAIACGTKVVSSNLCGCPEQIKKDTGIVVSDAFDINEYINAARSIIN